jgi:hypothetical protein
MLGENANEVMFKLPHRQFVFTISKCLRPYFFYNHTLFFDILHLIFDLIREYYDEVAGKPIYSPLILSHQTFGDFSRPNPHWHGISAFFSKESGYGHLTLAIFNTYLVVLF